MQVEIIQGGQSLRTYNHNGQIFAEAPPEGAYEIRLKNLSASRRLAIVSVDGVNVIDGTDAGFDGPGYVLRPWETLNIKGWRRTDNTVAKFTFQPQEGSYAARTGRGTQNTGVIGVAVFDEKTVPFILSMPASLVPEQTPPWGIYSLNSPDSVTRGGGEWRSSTADSNTLGASVPTSSTLGMEPTRGGGSVTRGRTKSKSADEPRYAGLGKAVVLPRKSVELGTGYGKEATMHTETTTFERASDQPALVLSLRYGVREKLIEWGVPVVEHTQGPQPFPAAASVPPPPGWRAAR